MNVWELPTSLKIGGVGFAINSDFRDIINILIMFSDPEYDEEEKAIIYLQLFYKEYEKIPPELVGEALEAATKFINYSESEDKAKKPRLMDWEQDAEMVISATNAVAGTELRSVPYCHWWTFLGYYMAIGESLFSSVISIRDKKSRGKKLEKAEQDFYNHNKEIIDLKVKLTEEEKNEDEKFLKELGL